jgi:hypothetical protein
MDTIIRSVKASLRIKLKLGKNRLDNKPLEEVSFIYFCLLEFNMQVKP